jgi:hypothetical protein
MKTRKLQPISVSLLVFFWLGSNFLAACSRAPVEQRQAEPTKKVTQSSSDDPGRRPGDVTLATD